LGNLSRNLNKTCIYSRSSQIQSQRLRTFEPPVSRLYSNFHLESRYLRHERPRMLIASAPSITARHKNCDC